jgi:capsular exopolysaccharide synthesis family protein
MYRVSSNPILRSERPEQVRDQRTERDVVPGAVLRTDEHLVTVRSPNSFEADQYRVLRHFLSTEGRQVLAVSSPAAGEGKTTTAVNLAATLAQSPGARVLLVDTDLRRPCVASTLGLGPSTGPGLAGLIVDERLELASAVRPTPFNLSVLPAGAHPTNAYQILESPRVGRLLEEARSSYDHVILDTPPLLLVPDCRLLLQWVDAFVIVVAAHRTPRRLLAETLAAVDPAKLAGLVFNGDHRPLSGYYKKYYGSYYSDRARPQVRRRWLSWWRRPSGRKSWR